MIELTNKMTKCNDATMSLEGDLNYIPTGRCPAQHLG